jgi:hypothetical protein
VQDTLRNVTTRGGKVDGDQRNGARDREIRLELDVLPIHDHIIDNDRPSLRVLRVHGRPWLIQDIVEAILEVADGNGATLNVLAVFGSDKVEANVVVRVVALGKDIAEERRSPSCVSALSFLDGGVDGGVDPIKSQAENPVDAREFQEFLPVLRVIGSVSSGRVCQEIEPTSWTSRNAKGGNS